MITADEALRISVSSYMEIIERKIKEAAEKGQRKVSLKGCIRIPPDEKKILEDNGFNIIPGHSGKGGTFDIIKW